MKYREDYDDLVSYLADRIAEWKGKIRAVVFVIEPQTKLIRARTLVMWAIDPSLARKIVDTLNPTELYLVSLKPFKIGVKREITIRQDELIDYLKKIGRLPSFC